MGLSGWESIELSLNSGHADLRPNLQGVTKPLGFLRPLFSKVEVPSEVSHVNKGLTLCIRTHAS